MARPIDKEVLAGFIEEAQSYLPSIVCGIESYATDPTQLEAIAEAHRYSHTIKGASSMVGLLGLSHIASNLEELLEDIASGKMAMDDEISSLLCEAVAQIEAYLDGVLQGNLREGPILAEVNRIFRRLRGLPEEDDEATLKEMLTGLPHLSHSAAGDGRVETDSFEIGATQPEEIPPELLEVFVIEAEDHLRNISTQLAAMEKESEQKEHLQDVRRSVHTLKGAAGAVGFQVVAQLAHRMEDLLDRLYQGDLAIDTDTLDLLYATADSLHDLTSGEGDREDLQETLDSLYAAYEEQLSSMPAEEYVASRIEPQGQEGFTDLTSIVPSLPEKDKNKTTEKAAAPLAPKSGDVVRVPLVKLDDLVKLVSELVINRSIFEQRMTDFARGVDELQLSSERLRRVSLNMENKYEVSALGGRLPLYGAPANPDSPPQPENFHVQGFDDLEFDRYTEFHLLSRELVETASDIRTIGSEMSSLIGGFNSVLNRQSHLSSEIQDKLMRTRMVPLATLTTRLHRAVRVLTRHQGKLVDFVIEGEDIELDKSVLDKMADPILHLLRNAVDHGIEPSAQRQAKGKPERGSIVLRAYHAGNQVIIQVSDDGAGLLPQILRSAAIDGGFLSEARAAELSTEDLISLVFLPGFSTAGEVSEVSGRGIGLDIVKTNVDKLKGSVVLVSEPGRGTTFTIHLPMTLAVMQALLVRAHNELFAIPRSVVTKILRLEREEIVRTDEDPVVRVDEDVYPVVHLGKVLDLKQPGDEPGRHIPVLILDIGEKQIALVVDHIVGGREIVIMPLGSHTRRVHGIAGATLMGDGRVVLILNPSELVLEAPLLDASAGSPDPTIPDVAHEALTIMIVDDSLSVRRVVSNLIKSAGWLPVVAKDGLEALEIIQRSGKPPDLILVDIEMPRMDGYELMSTLKAHQFYRNIPLVVLTSRAGDKHRRKALEVGASEYIVKPFQDEMLFNVIHQLVQESSGALAL